MNVFVVVLLAVGVLALIVLAITQLSLLLTFSRFVAVFMRDVRRVHETEAGSRSSSRPNPSPSKGSPAPASQPVRKADDMPLDTPWAKLWHAVRTSADIDLTQYVRFLRDEQMLGENVMPRDIAPDVVDGILATEDNLQHHVTNLREWAERLARMPDGHAA